MLFEIIASVTLVVMLGMIITNFKRIKRLEDRQLVLSKELYTKLSKLNQEISTVVSNNNKLNVKNISTVLEKVDELNDKSGREDTRMQNEIASLRRKLTFLMENDQVFNLIKSEKKEKVATTTK